MFKDQGTSSTCPNSLITYHTNKQGKTMDFANSNALWCGVVALIFIAIVLSTKNSRARRITKRPSQLPPLVNGTDLLALVPTFFIKGLPAVFSDLYLKHGSVFMLSFFGVNITLLFGPEVLPHFLQGLDSEISNGKLFEFSVPIFGKEIYYGRDPATRTEQMRFNTEALKPTRLKSYFSAMLQEVESYFAKWGNEGIVDLKLEFEQLIMSISTRCLLGEKARENVCDEVNTLFRELGNGMTMVAFLFPYLPTPANRKRDRARIRLTQILSDVVESRKRSGGVDDTLQHYIDSTYKDGRSTTLAEVVGLAISLVFAGQHTSAIASTWLAACLLSHPTFFRAAIEEQDQITKRYKDGLEYNAFMEMDTLHNCIKEALRMHPPAPMQLRRAHKQFTVHTKEGKQYVIPEQHIVVSPTIVSNNIPSIYKDPQVYDPLRFSPERKEDKVGGMFSFTSFGGGRHICTGEAYAYMQIKVIWSHLLRNFELEMISPFPKIYRSKLSLQPKGNLFVRYKRTGFMKSLN